VLVLTERATGSASGVVFQGILVLLAIATSLVGLTQRGVGGSLRAVALTAAGTTCLLLVWGAANGATRAQAANAAGQPQSLRTTPRATAELTSPKAKPGSKYALVKFKQPVLAGRLDPRTHARWPGLSTTVVYARRGRQHDRRARFHPTEWRVERDAIPRPGGGIWSRRGVLDQPCDSRQTSQ
jgi:hypothetical protein